MIEKPTVKSSLVVKDVNFTLIVYAYRNLTPGELNFCLATWKRTNKRRALPKNKTVVMYSGIGSDM